MFGLLVDYWDDFGFWRNPFTAEDPMVGKWCNAKFVQMNKKLIYILDGHGWVQFFIFGWTNKFNRSQNNVTVSYTILPVIKHKLRSHQPKSVFVLQGIWQRHGLKHHTFYFLITPSIKLVINMQFLQQRPLNIGSHFGIAILTSTTLVSNHPVPSY